MSAFKFYRRKAGTQGLLIDSRRFVRGKSKFPFSATTRRPAKFRATSPKSNTKSTIRRAREFQTAQRKEALLTDIKAKATINNALFGRYFFTCDRNTFGRQNRPPDRSRTLAPRQFSIAERRQGQLAESDDLRESRRRPGRQNAALGARRDSFDIKPIKGFNQV
jgi:hypothetical protein